MDIDTKRITERDKKDYWIITRKEKALNKLSEEEKISLSNNDAYYKMLDRITDKDLGELTEEELSIIAIKRELDFGYAYAPQIVKNNATFEEVAIISEHLAELPGVDIQMRERLLS
jgi:penicillin-binding protein A